MQEEMWRRGMIQATDLLAILDQHRQSMPEAVYSVLRQGLLRVQRTIDDTYELVDIQYELAESDDEDYEDDADDESSAAT